MGLYLEEGSIYMGGRRSYIQDINLVSYLGDIYSGGLYMGGVLTGFYSTFYCDWDRHGGGVFAK